VYTFDNTVTETLNTQTLDPTYPDLDVTVMLTGFFLTSANELFGHFDVSTVILSQPVDLGDINFTGTMSAVPVPGMIWLLGSGLLSLAAWRKRGRE
jgi:hypothetical protein